MSFCFSPVDLGVPASRPHRYTLAIKRSCFKLRNPFDLNGFGAAFFRRCVVSGHKYLQASPEIIERYIAHLARNKHLPPHQANGQPWSMRELLAEGTHQRLIGYEKPLGSRLARYIVNVCQNFSWCQRLSEICPTLLTRTSRLWDMQAGRLFVPEEHLAIMGVPIFAEGRKDVDRFSVELLALSQQTGPDDIQLVAGNGMHMAAVGHVLVYLLSMAVPVVGP